MGERTQKTILLVEDDFLIAASCASTLAHFGYSVLTANSGQKAVELGSNPEVDLILMDIDLGKGLNGPEAAALILKRRSLPIVFLTAHAEREMVDRVRGITRYGYVIKNSGDFVLKSSIEMAFELFEARRELLDRDEKYRLLADNVADLLWIMNPLTGAWIYMSPSVERLRGYSAAEAMGQSLEEILTPESLGRARALIAETMAHRPGSADGKEIPAIELEHTCKGGGTVWAEVATRLAADEAGGPILIGITRDISERRRAELALAESQALQISIADSTEDLIWSVDSATFRLLTFNRAMVEHFLRSRGIRLAIGMEIEELFPPGAFVGQWHGFYERALNQGPYTAEYLTYAGDKTLLLSFNVLRRDGAVFGVSVFAKDITEALRAAGQIRMLKSSIDGHPDAMYWMDADDRFVYVNDSACASLGYSREELLGMSVAQVNPMAGEGRMNAAWEQLRAGKAYTLESIHRRRDGSEFPVEISSSFLRFDGGEYILGFAHDLSQRRAIESALSASEERRRQVDDLHRAILMSAIDGFCLLDTEGRILEANEAYCRMCGYSEGELLGLEIADLEALEGSEEIGRRIREILATGLARFESRHRRKDGSLFDVDVSLQLSPRGKGFFAAFLRDITDRKLTEAALREGEDKLRRIISSSSDLICEVDAEGRYTFVSERFEKVLGYRPEELIGRLASDLVHPDDLLAAAERYDEVKSMAESSVDYWRFRDLAGRYRLFECRASVTRAADGSLRTTVVSHDVSEQKLAEAALQASESRFRALSELMSDFAYALHVRPDGRSELEWIFGDLGELTAYGLGEFEAKGGLLGLTHEDDLAEASENQRHLVEMGRPYTQEFRIRRKSGETRWLRTRAALTKKDGQGSECYIAGRDITERRQAEERIRSLLAEKELILREVHHRIKNNFNTVHSLLMLQAGISTNRETAAALEDAGSRVRGMMMLYSNIHESASDGSLPMSIYLPALVREIVASFPRGGSVRTEVRAEEFLLGAEKVQPLGMIVNELLTNIMKSAFDEGSEGLISVTACLGVAGVCLSVADNGRGIPESVDFERSTGFGLMLVGALARQLDGTVRIERGGGTRVVLEFPR